ncbi:GAF domain-containing protein [Streptomyces sp. NPDC058690]|uniref:GAF domain-containing protein n=1 Tax=Streptomyces sp. NPDC058690 TaxID=3346600 RepID=UPI00365105C7
MTSRSPVDVTADLTALEEEIQATVGVRLFTVLAWLPERRALRRVHTTHPEAYPIGGEKTVEVAGELLEQCIARQLPYLGPDPAAVRAVFADHRTIDALGCGAVINVPVVDGGHTLGLLSVLDAEGTYDEASVRAVAALADGAVPALRAVATSRPPR